MNWLSKTAQDSFSDFLLQDRKEEESAQQRQQQQQDMINAVMQQYGSQYFYHGTTSVELPKIQQHGLAGQSLPWNMNASDVKSYHVFLTFDEADAEKYSQGEYVSQVNVEQERGTPVLLRIPANQIIPHLRVWDLEQLATRAEPLPEVSTPMTIPPNMIEANINGVWMDIGVLE